MPQDKSHHLSPLSISSNWHKQNRSLSSLSTTSEAATFHSALAHPNMEMLPLSSTPKPPPTPTPEPASQEMARQDSGYAETKPRTSISSASTTTKSSRPAKPRRRTTTSSSSRHTSQAQALTRPSTRPASQSRHTSPPYQFFQFPTPSLPAPTPAEVELEQPLAVPPPPPTVHYWTSDSTRRLEYAAIDAASKGVRGFLVRLVPDCILPVGKRRTRFHGEEQEDTCSVRRYRLVLPPPEEGDAGEKERVNGGKRPWILRRWTTGWVREAGGAGMKTMITMEQDRLTPISRA